MLVRIPRARAPHALEATRKRARERGTPPAAGVVMLRSTALVSVALALSIAAIGCASPVDDTGDGSAAASSAPLPAAAQRAVERAQRLATAKNERRLCQLGATTQDLLAALEEAVAQGGAQARAMIAKDAAITEALRGDLMLPHVLGKAPLENLEQHLPGAIFYGPAPGAYGNAARIELGPGGVATFFLMHLRDDGTPEWTSKAGRWAIKGTRGAGASLEREIHFFSDEDEAPVLHVLRKSASGPYFELEPIVEGGPVPRSELFLSLPDECSA